MDKAISELTNQELHDGLKLLVSKERKITEEVIRHFTEVETRRAFSYLGYRSMFDYATRYLGYSDTAAVRRIKAARAAVKQPKVYEYLANGEINLSTLHSCSEFLGGEKGLDLLEQIRGKSQSEVERLTAPYRAVPLREVRDRVKPICIGNPVSNTQGDLFEASNSDEFSSYNRSGCEMFQLSFAASDEFVEKLSRAKELLFTGEAEDLLLENVLGTALQVFLEKRDPKERLKRRRARLAKKSETVLTKPQDPRARRIPAWLRDEVFARDEYRCVYPVFGGHPCGCPLFLEIDHIIPFACGGETTLENLRAVCSEHNHQAEIDYFGEEFVARKIAAG